MNSKSVQAEWQDILKNEEKILFSLRALYRSLGYVQYRMRKFEEYDLYAGNKDFLVSGQVITFQDTDGKLLALKPDVTLSIVRSGRDEPGTVQKVYYQENVYRVAGYSGSFREIMQAGVECIGEVDGYQLAEVIYLAAESLRRVSPESVLALSHLGAAAKLMEEAGLSDEGKKEALSYLARKSAHEMTALCGRENVPAQAAQRMTALANLSGAPEQVLPRLRALGCEKQAAELEAVMAALSGTDIYPLLQLDFSVVNDPGYYNGLVFQGYVGRIPERVIAGGQYDLLMRKMGRTSRAVGFAVYLDTLERLDETPALDADVLLLYPEGTAAEALTRAVASIRQGGLSVSAQRARPEKRRFGRTAILTESGEVRYES